MTLSFTLWRVSLIALAMVLPLDFVLAIGSGPGFVGGNDIATFFYSNTVVGFVLTITLRTRLEGGFLYLKCHSGLL